MTWPSGVLLAISCAFLAAALVLTDLAIQRHPKRRRWIRPWSVLAIGGALLLGALAYWLPGLPDLLRGGVMGGLVVALFTFLRTRYNKQKRGERDATGAALFDRAMVRVLRRQVAVGDFWRIPGVNLKITVVAVDPRRTEDPIVRSFREGLQAQGHLPPGPHSVEIHTDKSISFGRQVSTATPQGEPSLILPTAFLLPVTPENQAQVDYSLHSFFLGEGRYAAASMVYVEHINPDSQTVSIVSCYIETFASLDPPRSTAS